jgi:threonine aldolase
LIDLRSDICSLPTDAMWEAMRAATPGWASIGEDEQVTLLQSRGAQLLGLEASLFVPTCTMANLAALLTLGRPGERVVIEATAHILTSESSAISEIAGLVPVPLATADGSLAAGEVADAIAASGARVLCLENTHTRAGGTVLDLEATTALTRAAHELGARVHLDGARLANAAVALRLPLAALASHADTVSLSLNKGLCAPFGALLGGSAELVAGLRTSLDRLGGGSVHKAGIAAAAGLVALETMIERLAEDHVRARELGRRLRAAGVALEPSLVETNIVCVVPVGSPQPVLERMAGQGVLGFSPDGRRIRLVTHRLIGDAEIESAASVVAAAVAQPA